MNETCFSEIEQALGGKVFLSVNDICDLLGCSERVVYNWMKRADPARRPPKLKIGHEIKFPRGAFIQWLLKEQT